MKAVEEIADPLPAKKETRHHSTPPTSKVESSAGVICVMWLSESNTSKYISAKKGFPNPFS
jgi:hypothetical protein